MCVGVVLACVSVGCVLVCVRGCGVDVCDVCVGWLVGCLPVGLIGVRG